MPVTARHVWLAAKPMLGRAVKEYRHFRALFGASPEVVATIYNITSFDHHINLIHLLWALSFMKTYQTYGALISLTGAKVSRKTYRNKVWSVLVSISEKT
jgi:hypothetical protein